MFNRENNDMKTYDNSTAMPEKYVAPYTDIYISKEGYQLFLDMPGIKKENFNVKVNNDELIVTGKKNFEAAKSEYLANEIFYNGFHRHFVLPNDVDTDKIDAAYENGVLKLLLHKREEFKPKLIEIK